MSEHESIIAVFPTRDRVEVAIQELIGKGLDRSQVSLLASQASVDEITRLGTVQVDDTEEATDRADTGNVQGLLAGIPAYLAAVLAAGVTVASGGTLAGVALAALGGGAAGGLLGAGAAKSFGDTVDARYDEQLAKGGIVIVVSPQDEAQAANAEAILNSSGAMHVGRHMTQSAT
jgi:outer membrane lipoprotein SlyB